MKKTLTIIFISFLLNSCGYKSILVNETSDFSIKELRILNEEKTSKYIAKNLQEYRKSEGIYSVTIESSYRRDISSKNKKGNPETFSMQLVVNLSISSEDKVLKNSFKEVVNYNNKESKFKLKTFENNLKNNLLEKILQDINIYVQSL